MFAVKYYNKVRTYSSKFSAKKHFVFEHFSVIFDASFLWLFKIINNWNIFWSGKVKILIPTKYQ